MKQLACARIKTQKIATLIGQMSNDFFVQPNFTAEKLSALVID